jgi:DNA-binding IclR family transcriptional regulator
VSRLTDTLSRLGYLHHSPRLRQYRLGMAVLTLGYAVLGGLDVRKVARPAMQALADSCNALVALGERERLDMIHLETCHSNSTMVTLRVDSGSRARVATTAFGRALLAALPAEEREVVFEQMRRHYREHWPKLKREIDQAIRELNRHGFCIVMGLWQPDINAVAVPLLLPIAPGSCRSGVRVRLVICRVAASETELARLVELSHRITAGCGAFEGCSR